MKPHIRPLSVLSLAFFTGCPLLPPELVTCEEADACGTTGPASTIGDETPTTSDGVQTVTGDSADPDAERGPACDHETSAGARSARPLGVHGAHCHGHQVRVWLGMDRRRWPAVQVRE